MLAYICQASCSTGPQGCYHEQQDNVFTRGPHKNGSNCCTRKKMFHDVCLHVFEGNLYCTKCFKTNVVSMCATETLFDNVFIVEYLSTQSPKKVLAPGRMKMIFLSLWTTFCSLKNCLQFLNTKSGKGRLLRRCKTNPIPRRIWKRMRK